MKWSLFFNTRRIIYGIISLTTLVLGIVLSVYLSHAWHPLKPLERGIIIAIIGSDIFTAVLLYLMIVVYFRWVLDFFRALCLFVLHMTLAIILAVLRPQFTCANFSTHTTCNASYTAFNITIFVIAGLLLVYTVFLFTIPREPPTAGDKPDLLANDPEKHKRGSVASVNSTTGLLGTRSESRQSNNTTPSTSPPVTPRRDFSAAVPRGVSLSDNGPAPSSAGSDGSRRGKLRKKPPPPPLTDSFRGGAESPPLARGAEGMHNPLERWMPPSAAYTPPSSSSHPSSHSSARSLPSNPFPPRPSPPHIRTSPSTSPSTSASGSAPAYAHALSRSPTLTASYRAAPELAPPPPSARSIAPSMYLAHDAHDAAAPYPMLPRALAAGEMNMVGGAPVRRYGEGDMGPTARSATQPPGGEQWRQLVARAATGGSGF